MENLFIDVKPGDKFIANNGDIYMYVFDNVQLHKLLKIGTKTFHSYNDFGICFSRANHDWQHELAGKYQETIDTNELNKLCKSLSSEFSDSKYKFVSESGFKLGYYKAKEEK